VNEILRKAGVYWSFPTHDSQTVHAELTSGLHSDEFYNLSKLDHPRVILELVKTVEKVGLVWDSDCICGQAYGSIALCVIMAQHFNKPFAFTEKTVDDDGTKRMEINRFDTSQYRNIVMAEDVITTGGTTVISVRNVGRSKVAAIFTIINRSGLNTLNVDGIHIPIISVLEVDTKEHSPDDCWMCKAGSKAIRPKGNWDKFTG